MRPLICANWKMHTDLAGALELCGGVAKRLGPTLQADVVLFPPMVFLTPITAALDNSAVETGAQAIFGQAEQGAFTGAVSASMVASAGARWLLVGHSERRQLFGDDGPATAAQLQAGLRAGLRVILCVGESLAQREAGETMNVIGAQLGAALANLPPSAPDQLHIAYEPIWAIGTGRTATCEQATAVHTAIRGQLPTYLRPQVEASARILYGGSVKPTNAAELMAAPGIDGALVGGASLQVDSFVAIVEAAGNGSN